MKELKFLIDNTGLLFAEDATKAGILKPDFYLYIKENQFEKVSHGVYAAPDCWADTLYILHKRCPSGVISHDEALYYYGLVDREPLKQTITVYTGYGTSRLRASGIKTFSIKKDLLDIGKSIVDTNLGHQVPMYDLERTICDLIRCRNSFEIQDYQTALKEYANRKDKDLNKLMEYSKLFHVDKKVVSYMEVLL